MRTNPNLHRRFRIGISVTYGLVSALIVVIGISYIPAIAGPSDLPFGLQFSTSLFPIWVFGIGWCAVGGIGIIAAARQLPRKLFAFAITIQVVAHLAWGTFYAVGWLAQGDARAYLSARTYLAFVVLLIMLAACIAALRPVPIEEDRP